MRGERHPSQITASIPSVDGKFRIPRIDPRKFHELIDGTTIAHAVFGLPNPQSLIRVRFAPRHFDHGLETLVTRLHGVVIGIPMPRRRGRIALTSVIIVQHVHAMGGVHVVPVGEESSGPVEFLPVEHVRSVWIDGDLELGVTFREGQSRAPYGVRQFWTGQFLGHLGGVSPNVGRERDHAQMGHLVHAVQILPELLGPGDVGAQHGVFVIGEIPHVDHIGVPPRFEVHV
mmetsp:Transcript_18828/g.54468  ORF Transcript_18828/g.54468 Transcript_18828/m.54468 type:complete len:230 (+) Transcript_18828:692-1381(+)